MKMEQTECSETSAYTIQTPRNYPEESIQHSEHGKSLKPRKVTVVLNALQKRLKLRQKRYLIGTETAEATDIWKTLAFK
jgi:hypothetical protein